MKAKTCLYLIPLSFLISVLYFLFACTSQPVTIEVTDTVTRTQTTTESATDKTVTDTITQTIPTITTVTATRTQTTTIPATETVTSTLTTTLSPEDAPLVPHALLLGMGACFACHPIPPGHEGNAIVEDFCGTCHHEAPMSDWKTF